jgi:hypothetical protein
MWAASQLALVAAAAGEILYRRGLDQHGHDRHEADKIRRIGRAVLRFWILDFGFWIEMCSYSCYLENAAASGNRQLATNH